MSTDNRCSIEECGNRRKYLASGWCQTHYHRWWRTGTTDLVPYLPDRDSMTYRTAHAWVEREWGRATSHRCVNCGDRAQEWAYDGTDPSEKAATAGGYPIRYSVWPEFYMPMCFPCHRRKDASARAAVRTHFGCGHPRSPENAYMPPSKKAAECRTCRTARARARQQQKEAA